MAATEITSSPKERKPVKPVKGRLVILENPHCLPPPYVEKASLAKYKIANLEGKVAYVLRSCHKYSVIHQGGSQHTLNNRETKYVRASRAEKRAWTQDAVKTMQQLPFATGKEHYHGNDPEVFFVDDKGCVIPAFAFLPSKADAKEEDAWPGVSYSSRGCYKLLQKMFWDGFQAEFTSPPSVCFGWAADYIHMGLKKMLALARKVNSKARPTWKPVVDIPDQLLDTSPPNCVQLGCDPSMNAYFEGPNPRLMELDASQLKFRFAGYHIHFGIGKKEPAEYANTVKILDAIAGVASVCLFRDMEDVRRRQYYGLAGEYRLPPHGLEWRTLSSCVLSSPYTFHLMSDLSRAAAQLQAYRLAGIWKYREQDVVKAINDLDVDLAWKILSDNMDAFKLILKSVYYGGPGCTNALKMIEKGALHTVSTDIVQSWKLEGTWDQHSDNNKCTMGMLKI